MHGSDVTLVGSPAKRDAVVRLRRAETVVRMRSSRVKAADQKRGDSEMRTAISAVVLDGPMRVKLTMGVAEALGTAMVVAGATSPSWHWVVLLAKAHGFGGGGRVEFRELRGSRDYGSEYLLLLERGELGRVGVDVEPRPQDAGLVVGVHQWGNGL